MAEHMEGADRLVCPERGLYLPSLYARGRTGGDVVSPLIIQAQLPYESLVLESMIPPLSTTPQVTTLPSNALSREIGERSGVEQLSCTPISSVERSYTNGAPRGVLKFFSRIGVF